MAQTQTPAHGLVLTTNCSQIQTRVSVSAEYVDWFNWMHEEVNLCLR